MFVPMCLSGNLFMRMRVCVCYRIFTKTCGRAEEGGSMIKLDLVSSSEAELEKALIALCSEFGSVIQTVIMRDGRRDFAFGFVVMSDQSEGLAVLEALGDSLI